MVSRFIASLIVAASLPLAALPLHAQQDTGFAFETVAQVPTTSVKDQARTGTCWSFATTSFVETELIRMGKGPVDLSEMFFVRMTYPQKAENYVRLHGNTTFGQGSLGGDVMRAIRLYGVMPESAYPGRRYGYAEHDHSELYAVLRATLDAVVESRAGKVSPVWPDAVAGVLDAYLGDPPEEFEHDGRVYTPQSFAQALGISPDNYVELTSFNHHPFDTWVALELPDNWARNRSYNIPLDEFMGVIDHAIESGFSVDWDGDVSERSFCHSQGVALWPALAWDERDSDQRDQLCGAPEAEVAVTQVLRQASFDSYVSTDDHLMHLTGIARDGNGTKYYITKNSWGATGARDGYVYMSEPYVRAKTMTIIVHKDALPGDLRRRIGI